MEHVWPYLLLVAAGLLAALAVLIVGITIWWFQDRRGLLAEAYDFAARHDWFGRIWYRWWCPYPVIPDCRASACIRSGNCGCDNGYRAATGEKEG